jgi:protein-disulfide isomerase
MYKRIIFFLAAFVQVMNVHAQWVNHENRDADVIVAKDPWAPIEVIMYYSFSCAHCAQFHEESWAKFYKDYVDTGKVKIVLRDVALDQVGFCASNYAQTLSKEDYLKLFHASMKNQREWIKQKDPVAYFDKIVQLAGLPQADHAKLQEDKSISDKVLARWSDAKKRYYLDGTPGFIINGQIYNYYMTYGEFEAKVKEALAKMVPQSSQKQN